jgi:hypothetical protein
MLLRVTSGPSPFEGRKGAVTSGDGDRLAEAQKIGGPQAADNASEFKH